MTNMPELRPLVTSLVLAAAAGSALAQPAGGAGSAAPPDDLTKAADAAAELADVPNGSEDLAKAADATADVAGVPAAPAATPPAAKPSSDDIDLGALGLDPATATATDDQLTVYGFADFRAVFDHFSEPSPIFPQDSKTFVLGNLNLYLAKNLTRKARALAEVRFTFLPNGSQNADGTIVDTTATDLTNYSRPVQWGGIVIERAYVEYDLTDHLAIRAGRWLTPYGIWNIDHGSPVIISTGRPFIIGEQFFPEHQTGLELLGSYAQAGFKLGYHATMSNGRGGSDAQQDQDDKFAFGGRLELETPWGLKLGGSYYRGRYTGLPKALGAQPQTYLEAGYGGDAQFDLGALHLQGEVIVHDRHYAEGFRAAAAAGFAPDARDSGWYGLAGYRFQHVWNVMPFLYYEDFKPSDHTLTDDVNATILGLNFRPTPALVLKATFNRARFTGSGLIGNQTSREIMYQAAWVF